MKYQQTVEVTLITTPTTPPSFPPLKKCNKPNPSIKCSPNNKSIKIKITIRKSNYNRITKLNCVETLFNKEFVNTKKNVNTPTDSTNSKTKQGYPISIKPETVNSFTRKGTVLTVLGVSFNTYTLTNCKRSMNPLNPGL
jgi:hypothetical protein